MTQTLELGGMVVTIMVHKDQKTPGRWAASVKFETSICHRATLAAWDEPTPAAAKSGAEDFVLMVLEGQPF